MGIQAKRNAKDTVFRNLFSQPEYLLELYRALHPEDTDVTPDMFSNVTIENVLTDRIYNDLGFTVGDRLLVLVEAQSTWSANILVRAFLYLAQSYQQRFEANEVNLYSSKRIELPEPELYVIFTGDRRDRPRELTLSENFFSGRQTALEVRVQMLYGDNPSDIIGQYVRFCRLYTEQVKQHGATEEAVLETIRLCRNENVLTHYLDQHETEAKSIMMSLFNEEYIQKAYGKEKYDEGMAAGLAAGRAAGLAAGRAAGKAAGKDDQAKKTALNLYRAGMAESMIAQMIGYPSDTVRAWLSQAGGCA